MKTRIAGYTVDTEDQPYTAWVAVRSDESVDADVIAWCSVPTYQEAQLVLHQLRERYEDAEDADTHVHYGIQHDGGHDA